MEVVELHVGGRHFTTSLATLTKSPDSMLAAMFSGRHRVTKDKDGRYFIDVNGDIFVYILDFLRLQTMPPPDKTADVKKYAEYFGIKGLLKLCSENTTSTHYADDEILSQDALMAYWASGIPNYSKYLLHLKTQLKQIEIQKGYFYLQLTRHCKESFCRYNQLKEINMCRNHIYACNKVINVTIENINDEKIETLFTVLTHYLNRIGFDFCGYENDINWCCSFFKLFKIDFCPKE